MILYFHIVSRHVYLCHLVVVGWAEGGVGLLLSTVVEVSGALGYFLDFY